MNKIMKVAAVMAAVSALASCTKEGAPLFRGNYSFKTSGTVEVAATGTVTSLGGNTSDIDEQLSIDLATEQGQMDIIATSAKEGDMIITMNVLGGDVYTTTALAEGDELSIEPFDRKIAVVVRKNTITIPVTVSGTAHRYDNTVIFTLEYEGEADFEGDNVEIHAEITGSDVRCVAKLNE